jgi:glycosyltransferase involved in cell wall biosynthesis
MSTVCLSMIVKDEAPVIARCLESVRPLIDAWLIVDTGSTDGTQDLVRALLRDLPGELVERPWVNFAVNRTEALRLAKGRADYVLLIDADETMVREDGFRLPDLTADAYLVDVRYDGCSYLRKQLVRDALPWRYVGVVHEYLDCGRPHSEVLLEGVRTVPRHDGARARDPSTYRRDALLLEAALIDDPDNARSVFYLAQSYRDAGDLEQAVRAYRRRAEMGGWTEEIWFSRYQVAVLEERLGQPWPEVLCDYLAAYQLQPDRAEPLFRIALHHQARNEHAVAHLFLLRAMALPRPPSYRLFVELPVYEYLMAVEYAVAAYYVGDHAAAIATDNAVLRSPALPPEGIRQVVANRRYSLDALHPPRSGPSPARVVALIARGRSDAAHDEAVDSVRRQDDVVDWAPLDAPLPELGPDDVLLMLPPGHRLAAPDMVRRVRAAFADPGCRLLYGPRLLADGRTSAAEPAPSPAAFEERGAGLAAGSPPAVRVELWRRAGGVDDAALWRAAGFDGVRFADEPLTAVIAPPAVRPVEPPSPAAGKPPLVSCLMVTRDRLPLARRAIRCFAEQTHPRRELVIVTQDARYRRALERHVEEEGIAGVRFVDADAELPLGALRNVSLDAASGDLVCQWDDDDCYHPERLARQVARLQEAAAQACLLTDHLHLHREQRVLAWIDWTAEGRVIDEYRYFPGSLLMRRDDRFRYPEHGAYARQGEDSVLLGAVVREAAVTGLSGAGHLYLYEFHGTNTFSDEHHQRMLSYCAPNEVLERHEQRIREMALHQPIPKPLTVVGADGPVFVVR